MRKLIVALLVAALCMVGLAGAVNLDDLPDNMWVSITYPYEDGELGGYFDMSLDENGDQIPETVYQGWCVQTYKPSIKNEAYCAYLVSTTDDTVDNFIWRKVNWIINNKGSASREEIQHAIWTVQGEEIPSAYASWESDVSRSLVEDADDSYVPECGEYVAVVVEACGDWDGQRAIIEVLIPCPSSPVPEFPTMMIPVFLVGSVLVGASVLKKE